jgi:hypothetical protein
MGDISDDQTIIVGVDFGTTYVQVFYQTRESLLRNIAINPATPALHLFTLPLREM